jgi:hypothetical protein
VALICNFPSRRCRHYFPRIRPRHALHSDPRQIRPLRRHRRPR